MTQQAWVGPQVSIAVYRPRAGRLDDLLALVAGHVALLRAEGLATPRAAVVMQAADGTLLEVFEWTSGAAIAAAHENPRVQDLWKRFGAACEYVPLKDVAEAQGLFAGFRPL